MTPQEAFNKARENRGTDKGYLRDNYSEIPLIFIEAMKLYGESKHDEACEAQKQACCDYCGSNIAILNAPKPEFKP